MTLSLRSATEADVEMLAKMNKQLIEDEGHRNPMTISELAARMRGWLQSGWNADLFERVDPQVGPTMVGYALYQHRNDEFFPERPIVYLRQFLITREHRQQGLGRRALRELLAVRFPLPCTVVVDVLTANTRGVEFWQAVGFAPYQMTLHARVGV
ncbi:MAG TPA: GNAT family N-acetyltransferase [bacterium]|nr:GNAT family N-acetyltransferase [bacterium]